MNAKLPNISPATIHQLYKKYKETGTIDFNPCSGRPKITSKEDDDIILSTAMYNKYLGPIQLKPIQCHDYGINISASIIHVKLIKQHAKMKCYYIVPLLTQKYKHKRYLFAGTHKKKKWDWVIFSDEKIMQLLRQSGQRQVLPDEQPTLSTPKKSPSIMFWAAFSVHRVSDLIKCNGNINGNKYAEMLQNVLFPYYRKLSHGWYAFIQDNAPPYRPKCIKELIEKNRLQLMKWPANSPDLNLIENLWAILQQRVWECCPMSLEQLDKYCREEWKNISEETL